MRSMAGFSTSSSSSVSGRRGRLRRIARARGVGLKSCWIWKNRPLRGGGLLAEGLNSPACAHNHSVSNISARWYQDSIARGCAQQSETPANRQEPLQGKRKTSCGGLYGRRKRFSLPGGVLSHKRLEGLERGERPAAR